MAMMIEREREASGMAGPETGLGTPVLSAQSLDSPSLSSASGPDSALSHVRQALEGRIPT